ncbi:MAG TPA: FAD-dependent oxidoreductase, partial [Terrimicrobiaceae bacterium]|nr:FAD-dependent oxidoreductase [Terrimicrobiaceae bacterium]
MMIKVLCSLVASAALASAETSVLYATDFSGTPLGKLPPGWRDAGIERSSPNWGLDGRGFLRVLWKGETGLLVYEGVLSDGSRAAQFTDGRIIARFKKTPDDGVSFGLAGRVADAKNFLAFRFKGEDRIELARVSDGKEQILASWVTRSRYAQGEEWTLELVCDGPRITGRVRDGQGVEQARVDALEKDDNAPRAGAAGLLATNFAGAKSFVLEALAPFAPKLTEAQIAQQNAPGPRGVEYPVLQPLEDAAAVNTPFDQLSAAYDVIVGGAGTSGWAAAVQAARMGARVLLVEESDWIGGQMAAAAVSSMDEEGLWEKFPVRERGLYREFHESMVNYYYTRDKDPFRAYYAWPDQLEGGYEPKIVRAALGAYLAEARSRKGPDGKPSVLDVVTGTRIEKVRKTGNTVDGVVIKKDGVEKTIAAKVLVEATEYGDLLPLAGARYRVGNVTSDAIDPASLVQYHTWVGVIREYPGGVPDHLKIKIPPPGYDSKKYRGSQLAGPVIWGGAGRDVKGPRSYRVLFAWRGMADSDSPMTGLPTQERHTQCGLNGGRQDYP